MVLRVFLRKFKVRRFFSKVIKDKRAAKRRKAWAGISHGFHMVERSGESQDSVLVQREQIGGLEVWLFGAFDKKIGSGIKRYLQSHLLEKKLSEDQIRRKSEKIMKKAYLSTMANVHEGDKTKGTGGSTTVLVMNSERLVAADFGGYRSVVCRDGMAAYTGRKQWNKQKEKWFMSDLLNMISTFSNADDKPYNSSKLVVTTQKVEPQTDFIILASDGIWEVMKSQEAVDLISHIEDAQKAAECLAEEAFTRMSKSTISCIYMENFVEAITRMKK